MAKGSTLIGQLNGNIYIYVWVHRCYRKEEAFYKFSYYELSTS